MKNESPQVDTYIAKSAAFARPILVKLRVAVHKTSSRIEESIKWGRPCFSLSGLLAGMSEHKRHVGLVFFSGNDMPDPEQLFTGAGCNLGTLRIESVKDLPTQKVLVAYFKQAIRLNEVAASEPQAKKARRPAPKTPKDLQAELGKAMNRKSKATFDGFSPSCKREYIDWILEAKRPATREQRIATTIEWLAEGKSRNWKYK
jgi:uncharacterized protein YdeI (YjbR/CyaY-like superfamily)